MYTYMTHIFHELVVYRCNLRGQTFFPFYFRDITAIAYCSQMNYLVSTSRDVTIRVWGPDWELKVAFVGHAGERWHKDHMM